MKRTIMTLALIALVQGAQAAETSGVSNLQHYTGANAPVTSGSTVFAGDQQVIQGNAQATSGIQRGRVNNLKQKASGKLHQNTGITGGVGKLRHK